MFWIYADDKGNYYADWVVGFRKTKNITKASFWTNKKEALTWRRSIQKKFTTMELKKATLKVIE